MYHSSLGLQRIPLWKHPISKGRLIQVATWNYHMFETVAHRPWKSFNNGSPTCSDVINLSRFCLVGCTFVLFLPMSITKVVAYQRGSLSYVNPSAPDFLPEDVNLSLMSSSIVMRQRPKIWKEKSTEPWIHCQTKLSNNNTLRRKKGLKVSSKSSSEKRIKYYEQKRIYCSTSSHWPNWPSILWLCVSWVPNPKGLGSG